MTTALLAHDGDGMSGQRISETATLIAGALGMKVGSKPAPKSARRRR